MQTNRIGIMQGRLSPPYHGRIQAFPVNTWQEEFPLAQEAQLAYIEWIYEEEFPNPLQSDEGITHIQDLEKRFGVSVRSVCADYYMKQRLVTSDGMPVHIEHLQWLIGQVSKLKGRYIVLPFVDTSSLKSVQEQEGLLQVLRTVLPQLEQTQVELHLETDLPPKQLALLLETVHHPLIRANYDMGNSASLGYDPNEELTLLSPWLGSVHVKDRLLGGGTVKLGTGHTNFVTCFRLFHQIGYQGTFILQVAREEGLSELQLAIRNRQWVEAYFEN